MAMRRLSIIDLKCGQQPIHNRDRTAWIVFNGEIYNYNELREKLENLGHQFHTNSDTEAIVHAYVSTAMIVRSICAACLRSRSGMKQSRNCFWRATASERNRCSTRNRQRRTGVRFRVQRLLLHPDVSRDIDHEALHYYLSFMCVPAPLTAYRNQKT